MSPISTIRFVGLIGNRPIRMLHGPEFNNALAKVGWREAHNAHILKRLKERGPSIGILTLNDFGRMLRNGADAPNPSGGKRRMLGHITGGGSQPYVVYRDDRLPGLFITISFD
jgi:hypothetical protein